MSNTVSGRELGMQGFSLVVAGHCRRYSVAKSIEDLYSGSAQGPVISHGFFMKRFRLCTSEFDADFAIIGTKLRTEENWVSQSPDQIPLIFSFIPLPFNPKQTHTQTRTQTRTLNLKTLSSSLKTILFFCILFVLFVSI